MSAALKANVKMTKTVNNSGKHKKTTLLGSFCSPWDQSQLTETQVSQLYSLNVSADNHISAINSNNSSCMQCSKFNTVHL